MKVHTINLGDLDRGSLAMENDLKRRQRMMRRLMPLALFGLAAVAIAAAVTAGGLDHLNPTLQPIANETPQQIPTKALAETPPPVDVEEIEPPSDPLDSLPLDTQRQVFLANDRAETNSKKIADSLYPSKDEPADAEGQVLFRLARAQRLAELRQAARRTLVRRFGIEEDALDAVLKQASAGNWSVEEIANEDADQGGPVAKLSPKPGRGGGARRARGGSRR